MSDNIEALEEVKDRAYEDRNLAVLGYIRSQALLSEFVGGIEYGWYPAPEDDDADGDEWAVVYVDMPDFSVRNDQNVRFGDPDAIRAGRCTSPGTVSIDRHEATTAVPVGQQSWHVPRDLAVECGWLPRTEPAWDGHDRSEKNARLRRFIVTG